MRSTWALASLAVLGSAGWEWIHERAADLAQRFAAELSERGLEVGPRGRSTIVSWRTGDVDAEVIRLAEAGFVVRSIPSHSFIRASVGAWSSEAELAELAELAAA
jgi:selenocysteine lyase/cysteine desulfurase